MKEQNNEQQTILEQKIEQAEAQPNEDSSEKSLEQEIADLKSQLEEANDRILRTAAEAQNLRKRAEKEITDAKSYALSSFAKELLSVCDNLERSIEAHKSQAANLDENSSNSMKSLVEGVELTLASLLRIMEAKSITKIEANIGDKFNPHLHQAMFESPVQEGEEEGLISNIVQHGYMIANRVLRPTLVGIGKKTQN